MKNVRITIFFLLVLIAALGLLSVRCFYLQFFKSDHYLKVSARQLHKRTIQSPQRGAIVDCRGRPLAASNKTKTIIAEPRIIKEPKSVSNQLADIVGMDAHQICKLIVESKNPGYVKIKSNATDDQCAHARKIHGIGIDQQWQRHYPMGSIACHVIGFTSNDNRGLGGIELLFDKDLRGAAGQSIFLADSSRRSIRLKEYNGTLSDGVGIILTIDATIQEFVRSQLLKQYKEFEAESAIAIVAEPSTGAILAMVSLPDFEPAAKRSSDLSVLRNRALADEFEPGSILKPITMAIALDCGAVNKNEVIYCEDGNYHGRGFGSIKEYRYHKYGKLSMRQILVKSSNIGMAKIGQKTGKNKLYKGLTLFGFGKKTGIDLPGEADGLLRGPDKWNGYSVTRIPFGQEITVTAIQLIQAYSILANGGRSVRPYVVEAIIGNDGKLLKLNRPKNPGVGFVIKPQVAKWIVTDALVGVINEGTGKRAKLEKWQVFGKTGTANIAKADQRGYSEDDYVASFIAGAPAENPQIVVLVSIRKPNKKLGKGYTGGVVASPVAAKIIEKTLNYLETQAY